MASSTMAPGGEPPPEAGERPGGSTGGRFDPQIDSFLEEQDGGILSAVLLQGPAERFVPDGRPAVPGIVHCSLEETGVRIGPKLPIS